MGNKDYYAILGVSKNASPDEIKKAFRSLARKYHPDKKGGDEKKFKEISEAYSVLSEPKKKQQYDMTGSTNGAGFSGFNQQNADFSGFQFDFSGGSNPFEDIFSQFGFIQKGKDIQQTISISLKEAVFGAQKEITIPYRHKKPEKKTISIPQGTYHGTQFQIRGAGEPSIKNPKAPPGNLYLTIAVLPEKQYAMKDAHLIMRMRLKLSEAMQGVKKTIRTLEEKDIEVSFPAGLKNGQQISVKGYGVPTPYGRGDIIIECEVETPRASDASLRNIAETLSKAGY